MLKKQAYLVGGEPDGPSLFKHIIDKCQADTMATVTHLKEKLINLEEYMVGCKYDIIQFNEHVNILTSQLEARGHQPSDMFIYLMQAYRKVPDS